MARPKYPAMRIPPYRTLLFLAIPTLFTGLLSGQDTIRTALVDQATRMMTEHANLDENLIYQGGFTVTKPEVEYEIDENKLYVEPESGPHLITLVGGLTETLDGRIQLLDQLMEVTVNGKTMQVVGKSLQSVVTEDGRQFVAFRRPLIVGDPPPLLELLAGYRDQNLYAYRRVELREPAHQKTPYDEGTYKKRLYREDQFYLISPLKTTQVKKLKDLIKLLPDGQRQLAQAYAKQERLRNREEDYITLLNALE